MKWTKLRLSYKNPEQNVFYSEHIVLQVAGYSFPIRFCCSNLSKVCVKLAGKYTVCFEYLCVCLYGCVLTVHRSALNDFQRSEGRELVPWKADRVTLLPGITLEECAKRCSESLDCRSHNPTISVYLSNHTYFEFLAQTTQPVTDNYWNRTNVHHLNVKSTTFNSTVMEKWS